MGSAKERHTKIVRKFQRRKVMVPAVNHTWGADLIDMQSLKTVKENKGYRYILTVVDVLSKYAWAVPLKDKQAHTVINAFQEVLKQSGTAPKKLWVDQGSEFVNAKMKKFLEPIEIYHTYSEQKAVPIERFNRTLKTRIWYKFSKHKSNDGAIQSHKTQYNRNETIQSYWQRKETAKATIKSTKKYTLQSRQIQIGRRCKDLKN